MYRMINYIPWIYLNQPYLEADKQYEGFIYLIENTLNGRKYIGKKSFWSRRKQKATGRRKTLESDWRLYFSSSDEIKAEIKVIGSEYFKRTILRLCKTKKEMSFHEQKEQWDNKVLETDEYYNTNIAGKYFVFEQRIYFSEKEKVIIDGKNNEWRKIHSENMKRLWAEMSDEDRAKKSEQTSIYLTKYWEEYRLGLHPERKSTKGMTRSAEKKKKLSDRVITKKHRENLSKGQKNRFSTGIYHTPFGSFKTCADARASGSKIQKQTLNKYCKIDVDKPITKYMIINSTILSSEMIGKTPREIGFWFEPKEPREPK